MSDKDPISEGRELAFDISRQFLTLALGGIAFAVGVTGSHPDTFGTTVFWIAIGLFAASVVAGFLFLMNAVALLSQNKSYDIYKGCAQCLSCAQILAVVAGAGLLLVLHWLSVHNSVPLKSTVVDVQSGGKTYSFTVPAGSTIEAVVATDGSVEAAMK